MGIGSERWEVEGEGWEVGVRGTCRCQCCHQS